MKRAHLSFIGERRLLHMSPAGPEQPAPQSGLNRLNQLYMREDSESWKNRYAYDTVQERTQQYLTRVRELHDQLGDRRTQDERASDVSRVNRAVNYDDAARDFRIESEAGYHFVSPDGVYTYKRDGAGYLMYSHRDYPNNWQYYPHSASAILSNTTVYLGNERVGPYRERFENFGQEYDTYAQSEIDNMTRTPGYRAGGERVRRMFWSVEQLERHYGQVEQLIADLDRMAGTAPGASLQERMLASRMQSLQQQIAARDDASRLQTIHIDRYNQPFTSIESRSYHLLRLPQGVRAVFVGAGGREVQIGNVITLSGSAQYLQLDTNQVNERSMRLRLYNASGEPLGDADIRRNSFNNLIFDFAGPPEPERPRERLNIAVNEIPPMYTGGNGRFTLNASSEEAVRHTTIRLMSPDGSGRILWQFGQGVSTEFPGRREGDNWIVVDPITRIVLTIDRRGNVDVTGGDEQSRARLRFTRVPPVNAPMTELAQSIERDIVVRQIAVDPPLHNFTTEEVSRAAEKEFVIAPPDQTREARVFFPTIDAPLALGASATFNGVVTIRRDAATGRIFATGVGPTDAPVRLWVGHGTQRLMPCDVTVERREPPPERPFPQLGLLLDKERKETLIKLMAKPDVEKLKKDAAAEKEKAAQEKARKWREENSDLLGTPPVNPSTSSNVQPQVDVAAVEETPSQTPTQTADAGGQGRIRNVRQLWNYLRNGSQNDNQNG